MSRNKEYIIFYRGNDFITPKVRQVLVEKQEQSIIQQDEEELARLKASASITSIPNELKGPLVAGTLAETTEAKSRWGDSLNDKQREEDMKRLALMKHTSLLNNLKRKLISVCFSKSLPGIKFPYFSFHHSYIPLYLEDVIATILHNNYTFILILFVLLGKNKSCKSREGFSESSGISLSSSASN